MSNELKRVSRAQKGKASLDFPSQATTDAHFGGRKFDF